MRTGGRIPVLLVPDKGETKQQALNKLLRFWEQKDRKRGDRMPTADLYWIKVLTRNNYRHDLNNSKLKGWKKGLLRYFSTAFIPGSMLQEIKEFFKQDYELRFSMKAMTFYDAETKENIWNYPDIRTLVLMARNHKKK